MAELVAVVGRSSTGKTRSVIGLDSSETLIVSVSGKAIPMKGFKKLYTPLSADGSTGNYIKTSDSNKLQQLLSLVDKKRHDIKVVVFDDYQYLMAFEFFQRADETGFSKFATIGKNGAAPLIKATTLREDLIIYVLNHEEEVSENFKPLRQIKTIGKMVSEKLTMEGLFTVVLFSEIRVIEDERTYGFVTNSDGTTTAKSPEGMFDADFIENDLGKVTTAIREYYGE
jgi:hypothetical protein